MSNAASTWGTLSSEFAGVIESAGSAVIAVHARRRIPSSGIQWRPGIIATADHAIEREDEITVTLPGGARITAALAGRDPSTDLAILKVEGSSLPAITTGEPAALRVGHWILIAGRTAEGDSRASLAVLSVASGAWRTWRGGELDRTLRLDRNLHPNFSGGPALDDQGRVLGIVSSGLSRYGGVIIPASTVERVVAELEKRGHIGRGYLGVGMQPVRLPHKLRADLKIENETAVLVMGVEPDSPAETAGVVLGDVLVALDGNRIGGTDDVVAQLPGDRVGKPVKASIIRGGMLVESVITVGERVR
jgi:S1-C subfamily serine protease